MIRQSASKLRIIQLSDCHVAADPTEEYRGANADRNLASLLPAVRAWQPDLVLLTGDVSEDGSPASYGRVSAMLGTAASPVLALPGNHDIPGVMRRFFPLGPWGGPFQSVSKGWQLILLDSTAPDRIYGVLSQNSLDRLDQLLQSSAADHVLVALHHQPVSMNSLWIDRYSLQMSESLFEVLENHRRIRCITWGHVHQDFQAEMGDILLLGSPSSVANSLPEKEQFTLDIAGPAGRWLELDSNGTIETGLIRPD